MTSELITPSKVKLSTTTNLFGTLNNWVEIPGKNTKSYTDKKEFTVQHVVVKDKNYLQFRFFKEFQERFVIKKGDKILGYFDGDNQFITMLTKASTGYVISIESGKNKQNGVLSLRIPFVIQTKLIGISTRSFIPEYELKNEGKENSILILNARP